MKTFEELGVSAEILQAIKEMGYVEPMPVQEAVIPYLLGNNNDVIALAQTGTGKTAAYGLPLLQKINIEDNSVQALVLSPTRELCLQIADDLKDYSKYIDHLHVLAVYGGSSIETQIRALKKGVHIIVATPGRLVDLMERGVAQLDKVENVVLDEADEMLDMGFSESIDAILAGVPAERNTLLFSATMSKEIERIAKNYLREYKEIVVGSRNEGAENVNHIYYLVSAKDRYRALKRVADYHPSIYAIIFCRTKVETQEVADKLIQDGYNAEALHGDLSQMQRDLTMQKFRQRRVQFLVATDVAARGLDVDDLTHVINYGLPDDIESYTHRSGRTGRAGKQGTSISIIHSREKNKVKAIEKQIGKEFVASTLPTGEQICEKQLYKLIDDIEKVEVNEAEIAPYLPTIFRKFDLMEKEDIIKKMVSMEFNTFLDYYRNEPEIEVPTERGKRREGESRRDNEGGHRKEGHGRVAEEGFSRLFINLGKMDGMGPRQLMGLLNRCLRGKHVEMGRIDLMRTFSFFEVPVGQVQLVLSALNGAEYDGRKVNVELSDTEPEGGQSSQRPNRGDDGYSSRQGRGGRNRGRGGRGDDRRQEERSGRRRREEEKIKASRKRAGGLPEWVKFFEQPIEGKKKKGKK